VLEKNRAPQSEKEDGEEAHRVVCAFKSACVLCVLLLLLLLLILLFFHSPFVYFLPLILVVLSICRSSLTKKKENAKKQHKKGEQISSHEGPSKERD